MSFRLLRHALVVERRCHYLLSAVTKFKVVPNNVWHRSVTTFYNPTIFRRNCVTNVAETDAGSLRTKQDAIHKTLKTELLSKNRVSLPSVQEYLRLCQETGGLKQDEAILLFECINHCLPNVQELRKQELINQIWTRLSKELIQQETVLVSYIKACRSIGMSLNYENLLIEVGIKPSVSILEALLDLVAEQGNVTGVKKIQEEIKIRGFPVSENMNAALIRVYGIAQDMKGVNSVVEELTIKNIQRTTVIQSQVIQAFLRNAEEKDALKLLEELGASLKEVQLLHILQTTLRFCPSKDLITLVLKNFPADTREDKDINGQFKNICSGLILQKKFDELCTFISCLPVPSYTAVDDLDIYAEFAMQEMVLNNAPLESIMKLINLLKTEKRNEKALRTVTGHALKYFSPHVNNFLESLSQEEQLRTHYFWPLLIQNSMVDGEVGVLKTLELMKKYNVEVDHDTLMFYVLPKLALTLKDVEKGVKALEAVGVTPSNLLTPLTSHLLFQQRYNETIHINSLYPSKLDTKCFINPLVTAFNFNKATFEIIPVIAKLVKVFCDKRNDQKYDIAGHLFSVLMTNSKSKNENQKIVQLVGEMSLYGIKISRVASEMLQQHLSNDLNEAQLQQYFGDFVDKRITLPADELLDGHIKHPRDMNLEELECHFTELKSKGLNTRGVLRRLLQLNVREKRYDRAMEIKKLCDQEKVDISPGMHAAIFDIYVKTGYPNEAGTVLRKLSQKHPGFLVDDHKIIDYAALLVEKENMEEAQRVLRMRAKVSTVKSRETLVKNVWQLLNNVANVAPRLKELDPKENHTKKFLEFLIQLNYCEYSNAVLGPVIKELLNKNDLKGAVSEYISLSKQYHVTPLQRQLMTVLVDASNRPEFAQKYSITKEESQEMLQKLIQATVAIHGPTNTNIAFIVALAEAGTEKQLRKVLIDPKARFSPDLLRKQCDYLNSEGKLDALLKLAKCSRGLGHIQEQHIYNMILDSLIKENNYEAAISLFDELLSDDEFKVSSEFIRNLVDLFKRNNLELPTNVALHAK